MKSQTLAVSLVLLLIAVATLPGLSFSLSSSVTSYNNQIIMEQPTDIPFGIYKDRYCETPWGNSAFSAATIGVQQNGNTNTYVTQTNFKDMSGSLPAYVRITGEGTSTLTINAAYSAEYTNEVLGEVKTTLVDIDGVEQPKTTTVSWKTAMEDGASFELTRNKTYLIQFEVRCTSQIAVDYNSNNNTIIIDPISVDLTFTAEGEPEPIVIKNNMIKFGMVSKDYDGVVIKDPVNPDTGEPLYNHSFIETSDDTVLISSSNDQDSFVGPQGGTSRVTLDSAGDKQFIIHLQCQKGMNNYTVTITKTVIENGVEKKVTNTYTPATAGSGNDIYFGLNGPGTKSNCTSNPFSGEVSITIAATQQSASDNHSVRLYVEFVNTPTNTMVASLDEETEDTSIP